MMVETLIATAPALMGRSKPQRTKRPPATGMATKLYAVAQIRFWIIFRYVARDSSIAPTTSRGSLRTRTIPADSIATSVARANRNSDIGGRQGRRVVDPDSHHCDSLSAGLNPSFCRSFLGGQNLGSDLIHPDASSNRISNGFRV